MQNCFQFQDLSVLGHGIAVMRKARLLYKEKCDGFVLPDWFRENLGGIIKQAHDWKTIKRYAVWHDIGKPYCRIVDENGKQHFPGHAEKSKEIFLEKVCPNKVVGDLIGNDMVLHTIKSEQLTSLLANGFAKQDAFTLLIVAFAELHANAEMFGGVESVGFKMKYKQLDKRGKQILTFFNKISESS